MTKPKFHVICGLPRAGSTLLCNILNQNPEFYASSTSPLPLFLNHFLGAVNGSLEMKNLLNDDGEYWQKRLRAMASALVDEFYNCNDEKVIFDKSRGWNTLMPQLLDIRPGAKAIVCVRDVKAVIASIEKQNLKTPLLSEGDVQARLFESRLEQITSNQGIVGSTVLGVMDLINRRFENCLFIKYEHLAANPNDAMKDIYNFLGYEQFEHDFKDVKNTATDPDGFYMHKYPHKGEGEVKPGDKDEWRKFLTEEMGKQIDKHFRNYQSTFHYA